MIQIKPSGKAAPGIRLLVLVLLLLGLASSPALARDFRMSFGVDVGYFVPVGNWTEHRYAPGVDQFQGAGTVMVEFATALSSRIHVAPFFTSTRLGVGDWEKYARAQGDAVSASALMTSFGMAFRYYALRSDPSFFDFDLGITYFNLSGDESSAGYSYDYDFMKRGVGLLFGVGYMRRVSRDIALRASVRLIYDEDGVHYADGESRHVYGIPVTVGVRYLF